MHGVDVVNILVFDFLLNLVDRKGNCFALPNGDMIFLDNDRCRLISASNHIPLCCAEPLPLRLRLQWKLRSVSEVPGG
jgi:hypothetical protein